MSKYVLKPVDTTPVDAVKLDGGTGTINIGGVDFNPGEWVIKGADGNFTTLPDFEFNEKYEPAPEEPAAEAAVEPGIAPEEIVIHPADQPEQIA